MESSNQRARRKSLAKRLPEYPIAAGKMIAASHNTAASGSHCKARVSVAHPRIRLAGCRMACSDAIPRVMDSGELGELCAGARLLLGIALLHDFLQEFACAFLVAHFLVGMSEFKLGLHFFRGGSRCSRNWHNWHN